MRGEDTRSETAGGGQARERSGPRHAAPRKSLLTKLQIPAGKAFALAAMPTAVFVGMGLTPRLALADGDKDIPFAPGPCVTRSDEPQEESASPSEKPSGKPSDDASGDSSGDPSGDSTDGPKPPGGGDGDGDGPEPSPGETPPASDADKPATPREPAPEPSASKSKDPLDPLGLGDALGDLLGVPDKETDKPADPAPEKPADSGPDAGAGTDEPDSDKPDPEKSDDDSAADRTEDAIRDAADKAGAEVEELDDAAKGLEAHKDDDIPEGADGKPRFPCPEADPEALAAAELEPGIPLLPDDPWKLESSKLTLRGLDYHGIVEVKTGSGKIKKALKFTASEVDIKDLHQKVVYPEGRTAHVASREDSTSTIRDGQVTMYTEMLTGNLFGLIPIEFTPDTPPPLNVPFAFFTEVEVLQAGQFGGTLTVPGLRNYITG
ncbi:hypothetical protein GCM10011583_03180 [Streptomyces camponoticapitis]|uniref:Hydrogenase expression protein HypF n=1 Tax=Streptomyces camponoticapitis TaxID=1616125 RepID=A0ABQ2DXW4_9ACTN|nr:hypothetical protein [Streptomyces camponoticapitis]GGJ75100.1 hypothetical protein GCM10011583_03180 [Streptomyces camponoticapitis]